MLQDSVGLRISKTGHARISPPQLSISGSQFGTVPIVDHVEVPEITSDAMIDFSFGGTTQAPPSSDSISYLTEGDLHIDVNLRSVLSSDSYKITPPPDVCDSSYGPGAKLFNCTTPLPAVSIV